MRIRFHQNLDDLKEKLLVMAGMAEQAIQRAIEAYRTRDTSICDLVTHGELAINKLEREIDQMALDLLAMEQPMAIDLRFILAVIKINADLERVGDQAVNIAERVCDLNAFAAADMPVDIPHMAAVASTMVRKALQAFIEGDLSVPRSLARDVHRNYFEPTHAEFAPRTMWFLSNAFTSALKSLGPIPFFQATAKVGTFLSNN